MLFKQNNAYYSLKISSMMSKKPCNETVCDWNCSTVNISIGTVTQFGLQLCAEEHTGNYCLLIYILLFN